MFTFLDLQLLGEPDYQDPVQDQENEAFLETIVITPLRIPIDHHPLEDAHHTKILPATDLNQYRLKIDANL